MLFARAEEAACSYGPYSSLLALVVTEGFDIICYLRHSFPQTCGNVTIRESNFASREMYEERC